MPLTVWTRPWVRRPALASPEEAQRFLQAARGDRLEALFVLALTTGLRQGEALALRWEDIDLEAGILTVKRQVQRKRRDGSELEEPGLVFSQPSHFKLLLSRASFPDIRFHDLRHTCATLLARKNVNSKIVQDTLDHASLSMTLGVYSHVQAAMKDEAAAAMDCIFS
jgi:integrase